MNTCYSDCKKLDSLFSPSKTLVNVLVVTRLWKYITSLIQISCDFKELPRVRLIVADFQFPFVGSQIQPWRSLRSIHFRSINWQVFSVKQRGPFHTHVYIFKYVFTDFRQRRGRNISWLTPTERPTERPTEHLLNAPYWGSSGQPRGMSPDQA